MGLFSFMRSPEEYAKEEIMKVNELIQKIRDIIRYTGDEIMPSNMNDCAILLNKSLEHYKKYERYVAQMDMMNRVLFQGDTVICWNGERVGILVWEQYYKNVFSVLVSRIKQLDSSYR